MKSTTTKQMITVLMLMAFSITAMAQQSPTSHFKTVRNEANGSVTCQMFTPQENSKVKVKTLRKESLAKPAKKPRKIVAKDGDNLVKLNIEVVEHNDIIGYPYEVYMFRVSPHEYNYLEIGENEVPAGTYNFYTYFYRMDDNGFECKCEVIKEDIVVDADMTLTFDAYEAKNYVSLDVYDINGNMLVLPKPHYKENGEFEWLDADYELYRGTTSLLYEGYGDLGGTNGNTYSVSHFYISDVSDKVSIDLTSFFPLDGKFYTVNHYAKNITSDIQMSNDPKDFIVHEEIFKPTPLHSESESTPYPVVTSDGFITFFYGFEMPDGKLTCCIGKIQNLNRSSLIDIASADYAWTEEEEWDGEIFYLNDARITRSLPILNIDGKLSYYNLGQTSFFREDRVYEIDGERKTMGLFPSNPVFSYPLSQRVAPMIGNSCPMLDVDLLHYPYYDGDGALKQIDVFYKGRYGEQRESDNMVAHLLIKEGDEVVYDDALQGSKDYMWLDPHWDNGIVDVTLTNENIDVDGLHGKNVTKMQADKAKADRCPPSLSMLDFRTSDNMVTDRFATAADGKLNFYAYDNNFNVTEDWQYYWTVSKPTVEVSYTPYDTEDWKPLPVEEDPSLFFLPTMGYFYSGSLKDVTGAGREGWFDLKIRLEDEAGNWQEQVISPAFRIDDLVDTGISDEELRMKDDNLKATTVYDLQGRMNNIGCCNKGVSIIRKKNGDVCKVVVR